MGSRRSRLLHQRRHPVEPLAESAKPKPLKANAPDISIWRATLAGNIEAVKQHLATGVNVNVKDSVGETPLHSAAIKGRKEDVKLLIAKGADLNAKDKDG